jgi:catechol 2,3-dioxygenase-like lactoylglutathione lyase family enzyme
MEQAIAKLLQDFDQGKMNRRQLIQSLAIAATAATTVGVTPAAAAEGKVLKVSNLNHVSYEVADYKKTRDFYAELFGMQVSEDDGKQCRLTFGNNILIPRTRPGKAPTPHVDHIAYTLADWDNIKDGVAAELKRRNIPIKQGDAKTSFHILDPDGFEVQFGGLRQ